MQRMWRGIFAVVVLLAGVGPMVPADAEAQFVNNRTFANTRGAYWRISHPNLVPGRCVQICRQRRCRSWVYVRRTHTSNGTPYCLFFRERRRMVYNNCCYAGYGPGGGGGGVGPGPGIRRVINYPRWRGYIVDWCRTWARNCGAGGANYYCRLRGFQRAQTWRTYRPGSTYVLGSNRVCRGGGCVGFRQVVCVGRRTGGVVPPGGGGGGGGGIVRVNYPRWRGAIVDWCQTWARNCGWGGAHQYCRRRGFRSAAAYGTYRPGRTYVLGSNRYCNGGGCVGFRYVNCRR